MAIRIVKKDDKGLYFSVEGYKARFEDKHLNYRKETICKEGDKVNVTWSLGRGGGMAKLDNDEAWYIDYV